MERRRCLVLGATGLIGSHTSASLVRQGVPVRVFARQSRPWARIPSQAEAVWGDWQNRADLDAALGGMDVVIHLVSSLWPQSPDQAPDDGFSDGTTTGNRCDQRRGCPSGQIHPDLAANARLLDICVAKGVKKLVFLSTGGAVYGPARSLPIPESHPTAPASPYGRLKLAMEHQISAFCQAKGLGWVILRGGNAFGEYHNPHRMQGVINVFLRQILQGRPMEIWGSPETVRDYLHAGEMARALGMAALSSVNEGVYNLGSGRGTSLKTVVDLVSQVTGTRRHLVRRQGRAGDVPGNVLDIRKIRQDLGWTPETDLVAGIEKTWQWVKQEAECQKS